MLRTKRKDEGESGSGGARPTQPSAEPALDPFTVATRMGPFTFGEDDALALKTVCDKGGDRGFVGGVSPSILRRLRVGGFVDLLQHPTKGTQAMLTAAGLMALPVAVKRLAAAPGMAR